MESVVVKRRMLSLQLNSEISAVITAMRQNAKWAVVPGKYNVSSTDYNHQLYAQRS
jgi:hypothetical protein